MRNDVFELIAVLIIISGLFFLYILPRILQNNAEHRIENLTINDFSVEEKEVINTYETRNIFAKLEVRKDKEGNIYYYNNGGKLYFYGSTPRITLVVNNPTDWEHTYRISKTQYDSFLKYVRDVDAIDIVGKEIHFILSSSAIKKYKLRTKDTHYYVGKLTIPYLNDNVTFTDEELENVLCAIKKDLKVSESLERLKDTV